MNKYIPAMVLLLTTAYYAPVSFAQNNDIDASPSITSNTIEDGSANPVNNSMSMGGDSGTRIQANSPVILNTKSTAAPAEVPATPAATTTTTHKHHHRQKPKTDATTTNTNANPPGDENPMGAGR